MSPQLDTMAHRAKGQPHARFTAWQQLNPHGAPGLSGETMFPQNRQGFWHVLGNS